MHPRLGEVILFRTRAARRISLSVRLTGEVRLSFPPGVPARRALAFLDEKEEWVTATRQRLAERFPQPERRPPEAEKARIEELRRRAKAELPPRTAELARQLGFTFRSITVRATRTKWGSCSARNDLSLSVFLVTLPPHLCDFVIVHELCHTLHKNHSPQFHAEVDRCLGGREREYAAELRRYHIF